MVYAAAFGISERVMKELAKAYPQVNDPAWLDANAAGTLFYWNYRPYGWYGGRYYGDSATADQGNLGAAGPVPAYGGTSFAGGFSDLGSQLSAGFADISSTIQAAALHPIPVAISVASVPAAVAASEVHSAAPVVVHSEAADESSHDTLHHRHVDRRRDHHGDTHRDTAHLQLVYRRSPETVVPQPRL